MFRKKHKSIEYSEEDAVHLKPLFGIRPGVYLAGLYGAVLVVILFFVLVYPGLANPGTVVRLTSEPFGAAVRVDGVYQGTAPCEVFMPKGTREIEFVLPGFEPYRAELAVQGRVFGSRLFPRRNALHGALRETAPGAALLLAAAEYGVWSFTGEPTATRQIPPVLSEGAYRSGPAASLDGRTASLDGTPSYLQGANFSLGSPTSYLQGAMTDLEGTPYHFKGTSYHFGGDMTDLGGDMTDLRGDMTDLRGDMTDLRGDMTNLGGDMTDLRGDITNLKRDMTNLERDMTDLGGTPYHLKGAMTSSEDDISYFKKILKGAARFTATRAGLRDLVRAEYIVDNAGLAASPVSLLHSAEDMLRYLSETPGAAQWLGALAPLETAAVLTDSPWYQQPAAAPSATPTPPGETGLVVSKPSIPWLAFRDIPGGTLVRENGGIHEIPDFQIGETKVSPAEWDAFVEANPEWNREHTKALLAQGFVTEDYLIAGADSGDAVTGVSWYGAKAYCAWLTERLPADYEARLPTETEWEYAAQTAALKDMNGSLWEWCENPFALNDGFPADRDIIEAIGSPERAVRGGVVSQEKGAAARGSLVPSICSPFGSFRLVIAKIF